LKGTSLFLPMDNALLLKQITEFADQAHGQQLRKYSKDRYIVHPIRVMNTCLQYSNDVAVHAAALLHDVIEDTPVDAQEIKRFLLTTSMSDQDVERTVLFVLELTDVYVKAAYPRMNRKARKEMERLRMSKVSYEAQTIKYADILDNADDIGKNDQDFAPIFIRESKLLLDVLQEGNMLLRDRVLAFLENQ
jgi:guanosine-3',5'-bis(diphosphate) 3'-pyrophosphohydrolase